MPRDQIVDLAVERQRHLDEDDVQCENGIWLRDYCKLTHAAWEIQHLRGADYTRLLLGMVVDLFEDELWDRKDKARDK